MKLTIFGPPGSGKGTYAKMLGQDFRVPVISIGDLLREEVENKSEIGLKVKDLMGKGELVSDEIVLEIVNKNISDDVVFDGFPRDMKQISVDVDKAINLTCSDEICIKRITNRLICSKCKKIYNLVTLPPREEGECDECGRNLISRIDENVVKDRLRVFKRETLPVINYFRKKGVLVEVDGERAIDEVYADIRKLFKLKE
jgi:adenylate kinase